MMRGSPGQVGRERRGQKSGEDISESKPPALDDPLKVGGENKELSRMTSSF